MIRTVNAALISTPRYGEMLAFYRDLLGIPLCEADHGGGRHAEADLDGFHFSILADDSLSSQACLSPVLSFHVDDIFAEHRRLTEAGAEFTAPPRLLPFGGWFATLSDPDGRSVGLMNWADEVTAPTTGNFAKPPAES